MRHNCLSAALRDFRKRLPWHMEGVWDAGEGWHRKCEMWKLCFEVILQLSGPWLSALSDHTCLETKVSLQMKFGWVELNQHY